MQGDRSERTSFFTLFVVGALMVTLAIGGTTLWVSSGARRAADKAVDKVSEFYLQELAGRRSQVVSSVIDSRFEEMHRAVDLMGSEDLVSQDALRAYIGDIEELYGLDLFALVDEEDVVYARYATYMGGSRYEFLDSGQIDAGDLVSYTSLYGAHRQVCLAIPVSGRALMGVPLKACFVQVDIDSILDMLALGDKDGGTSFGLYYRNGDNLSEQDFGPILASRNLLEEMHGNLGEQEWERLRDGFSTGGQGGVDFVYKGDKGTLYYMPIRDTNWVLTVLVADNLIQEQISGVSDEMVMRSTVQILVVCFALLSYFGALILRLRKVSTALLEEERQHSRDAGERAERSEAELGVVRTIAYKDTLTGVKNKNAYAKDEEALDEEIQSARVDDLAVVVCDLNGLKHINDTLGHSAGDEYIRAAGELISDLYAHSSVYRIGGDEFVVVLRGEDYEQREEILAELNRRVEGNIAGGGVVLAAGMAEREPEDRKLHDTFHRADQRMYARKLQLKEMGAITRE